MSWEVQQNANGNLPGYMIMEERERTGKNANFTYRRAAVESCDYFYG